MSIDLEQAWLYRDLFPLLKGDDPPITSALVMGRQLIADSMRGEYPFPSVVDLFRSWGWKADDLDLFDAGATFRHDLNTPVGCEETRDLVFDVGTLEHVADSRTALRNYLGPVRVGGLLFLLTPVRGYFDHGLHTFSPEYILGTLELNGFDVESIWWCSERGEVLAGPGDSQDVLISVLARKTSPTPYPLRTVQQRYWTR